MLVVGPPPRDLTDPEGIVAGRDDRSDWDQDATAIECHYAQQDRAVTATDLRRAAEVLAARFEGDPRPGAEN